MSTTIEKLLPQLTLIDDLVKWKMRRSYWRVMFSPLEPNDRAWLLSYVDRKWRDIHGQCSPKGQLPLNAVGSVNSRFKAQHLAAAYNAVIYAAHHEIDPAYAPIYNLRELHEGYSTYLATLHGNKSGPMISVEQVYRALLDTHEWHKCQEHHVPWAGAIPVYCSNRRTCDLHGALFLYSSTRSSTNSCPFCGCSPRFPEDHGKHTIKTRQNGPKRDKAGQKTTDSGTMVIINPEEGTKRPGTALVCLPPGEASPDP